MKNKFYVYRFLNKDNDILYIGKTENTSLDFRMKSHTHLPDECYLNVNKIEYIEFKNRNLMIICERYLIPTIKPKYNKEFVIEEIPFPIPEFNNIKWTEYKKTCILKNLMDFRNNRNSILLEIKKIRKKLSYTQNDMALSLGISLDCYKSYEQGRRAITLKMVDKISSVLDVKLESLIFQKENN
jgi:DNA-binding XRE family transcriptional regulator/predicted GIY-YIG superfamily endonuclease